MKAWGTILAVQDHKNLLSYSLLYQHNPSCSIHTEGHRALAAQTT